MNHVQVVPNAYNIYRKISMKIMNFWSSAEIIHLVNYFCCALYCIILLSCCSRYLYLETSIDICIFVLFCFVLCCVFVCSVCVLFFSDKFHVRLFVQQNLWTYETIWYDMICMYVLHLLLKHTHKHINLTYVLTVILTQLFTIKM
jgi:hypothetical protein